MKVFYRALFLSVLLIAVTGFATAQLTDTLDFVGFKAPAKFARRQNLFKSSPVPLFMGQIPVCGELRITYERMLTYNQSFILGGSYNFPNLLLLLGTPPGVQGNTGNIRDFTLRGGRIMLGYRYYPVKALEAPKGLFVGALFSYSMVKIKEKHGNGSYELLHYLNGCAVAGYQFVFGNHMCMEFITGLGYRKNYRAEYDAHVNRLTTEEFYLFAPFLKHFKPLVQFNMGYNF